jgi:hypothetical protein
VRDYLQPLLFFQRFFIPALLLFFAWAAWRTIRHKDAGVGLGLYLILVIVVDSYMNTGIFLPGLEKGSVHYSEVCALFLLRSRPAAQERDWTFTAMCALVGGYILLLFVAALRSDPLIGGIFEFRRLMIPQILALLVTSRGFNTHQDYRRFRLCLMLLAVMLGVFVFWDMFFDRIWLKSEMLGKPEYWTNRSHGRFGGMFLNPNLLGAFTVLAFPPLFVGTLNDSSLRAKLFGALACMSLVFCLVETQSRGPLLAFGIVLCLLIVGPAGRISRTRRIGLFLPFALLLMLVMPGFFDHAAERFQYVDQELGTEARTRQTTWVYAQQIIADNPIAGIGFGEQQFIDAMNRYGFQERYGQPPLDNPHNSYLQMTVYAGFPVLIAFVLANVLLLVRSARFIIANRHGLQTPVVFGIAVALAGYLAVIYPDMHMFTPSVAPVYWVFFGLLLSIATRTTPAEAAAQHANENSRPDVGNARQHLVGESVAAAARYHGNRNRAASAGLDREREARSLAANGAPPRAVADRQQAPLQPRPGLASFPSERERWPLPGGDVERVPQSGADRGRRQR